VCVAAAEAMLAAGRDDASATAALDRLDERMRAVTTARALPVTAGNIVAARLYAGRGDPRRALDIIRRRAGWTELLSTQLRDEGRLAALAGEPAGAIRAYRHYLALRAHPERRLRTDAEVV